jgi:hypothetical protein
VLRGLDIPPDDVGTGLGGMVARLSGRPSDAVDLLGALLSGFAARLGGRAGRLLRGFMGRPAWLSVVGTWMWGHRDDLLGWEFAKEGD